MCNKPLSHAELSCFFLGGGMILGFCSVLHML